MYIEAASIPWQFSRRTQLGLYYLAQHADDHGFRVRVDCVSANDQVVRRIRRLARKWSCATFGFYVDQDNLWDVRRVLAGLHAEGVRLNVIVGGPQVTAAPELTLERLPEAAVGVIGEGEDTFVDLLRLNSFGTQGLLLCPGLAVPTEAGVVRTTPRPLVQDLDAFSIPDREKLTLDPTSKPMVMMITGRGCTGTCAFCYEGRKHPAGKRLRLHSVRRCLEEFDYLVNISPGAYICILDDTFVADAQRLREFSKGLVDRYDGKMAWFCEARADTMARHEDLLPLMVRAGLVRLQVGGESGCQEILDAYNKRTTLDQLRAVVESAKAHGLLSLYINFITGGAFESQETFARTLDFALELLHRAPGCVSPGSSIFTPYPGTPMNEQPENYGIQVVDPEGVTGMGDKHAFCRTQALTRLEILEINHRFRESLGEAMTSLCDDLPLDLVVRHFHAHYEWGLATEWYERLSQDAATYGYFESIYNAGGWAFNEIMQIGLSQGYPIRLVELEASRQNRYLLIKPSGGARELDELEGALMELSAGKLDGEAIVTLLCDRYPEAGPEPLRQAILGRFESFDQERLIVWRTNRRRKIRLRRSRELTHLCFPEVTQAF